MELKERFRYLPFGVLQRLVRGEWRDCSTKPTKQGYLVVNIDGKIVLQHRVVWYLHYGNLPKGLDIDHINRNKADNRIENLRAVSRRVNNMNSDYRDNSVKSFNRYGTRFEFNIQINGKTINYTAPSYKAALALKDLFIKMCDSGCPEFPLLYKKIYNEWKISKYANRYKGVRKVSKNSWRGQFTHKAKVYTTKCGQCKFEVYQKLLKLKCKVKYYES